MYWEFYEKGFSQAVRQGDWKAVRKFEPTGAVTTELYNLKDDLSETDDLAGRNPERVQAMQNLMKQAHTRPKNNRFQAPEL